MQVLRLISRVEHATLWNVDLTPFRPHRTARLIEADEPDRRPEAPHYLRTGRGGGVRDHLGKLASAMSSRASALLRWRVKLRLREKGHNKNASLWV